MDVGLFGPLFGVFMGWLLASITAGWKTRAENRKIIGRLLAKLLLVYRQVHILIMSSEQFKDNVSGWEEYERIRKRISDRHFLEGAVDLIELREALNELSGIYPTRAWQLQSLVELLSKAKNASFKASVEKHKAYISMLSIHEVGLDQAEKELRHAVIRLAWKHSPLTYLGVLRLLNKGARGLSRNQKFIGGLMADIRAAMNEDAKEVNPQADASADDQKSL